MAKNATINMRIDASLKTDVERILHMLGISTTEAINGAEADQSVSLWRAGRADG